MDIIESSREGSTKEILHSDLEGSFTFNLHVNDFMGVFDKEGVDTGSVNVYTHNFLL